MIQRCVSMIEVVTTLDGTPQGRAIQTYGFPYMDSTADAWFIAHGPKLPLRITGIQMLLLGNPSMSQDGYFSICLDQKKQYWHDCGDTYPVATQPSTQYRLMPLGVLIFRQGQQQTLRSNFAPAVPFTSEDCLIVDAGGTGGGGTQLAWSIFYESPDPV